MLFTRFLFFFLHHVHTCLYLHHFFWSYSSEIFLAIQSFFKIVNWFSVAYKCSLLSSSIVVFHHQFLKIGKKTFIFIIVFMNLFVVSVFCFLVVLFYLNFADRVWYLCEFSFDYPPVLKAPIFLLQ